VSNEGTQGKKMSVLLQSNITEQAPVVISETEFGSQ